MSTSLNVVSIAAFSWASLSLFAIVNLNLVIFTLSSGPCLTFLSEGEGLDPIRLIISSFNITPFLPVPLISLMSTFASFAILRAAGDIKVSTFAEIDFFTSFFSLCSSFKIKGSSSLVMLSLSNFNTGSTNLDLFTFLGVGFFISCSNNIGSLETCFFGGL